MATIQSNIVCDNSTLTNFKAWAQAISTAFSTFGWTQSTDTGQVNWSTVTLPGSGVTVYEIWQPNDGISPNFFAKIEYGNWSGQTNSPFIRVGISTSTNGSGTPTGTTMGPVNCANINFTAPSSSTQYECNFSGTNGRISVMMWRQGVNQSTQIFAIERSVDNTGAYTNGSVTVICAGANQFTDWPHQQQQSILFGVGAGHTADRNATIHAAMPPLAVRRPCSGNNATTVFNGGIPFDTVAPVLGYYDYPLTVIGVCSTLDVSEGVPFSTTIYGNTVTYIPTFATDIKLIFSSQATGPQCAFCVRYD